MRRDARTDRERLQDISSAVSVVEQYATRGKEMLNTDPETRTMILHHLQVIGEACGRVSHSLLQAWPEVPWRDFVDIRNEVVHDYFDLNLDRVWTLTQRDLPLLKQQIDAILAELDKRQQT